MEKKELLCTVGGNASWGSHRGKQIGAYPTNRTTTQRSNAHPGHVSRESENTDQERDQYKVFIAAPLTISKIWKQPKCPSLDEWIKEMWYMYLQWNTCACVLSHFSHVQLFVTLQTVARQAALSMGFSRKEYWSGLPCPPPGDLPEPGIEPLSLMSPALTGGFFTTGTTWEAHSGIHSAIKKNELLPHATTGIDLVK